MKKLLLTSFLFLAVTCTLMAQNREPKKLKLLKPKTERNAVQDQRIAEKKSAKLQTANTSPVAPNKIKPDSRKAARIAATNPNSREAMKADIDPAAKKSGVSGSKH